MRHIEFERHVPYSAEQMIELVANVHAYPEFVPNCEDMYVRNDPEGDLDKVQATMSVAFGPITGSYTSEVVVDRLRRHIHADAIDGPFSQLQSTWMFTPDEQGTMVRFAIDFEFSNRLLGVIAEPVFAAKQEEVIDAFVRRADQLFGQK